MSKATGAYEYSILVNAQLLPETWLKDRSAQICQCGMVHRCRIAAYSPFNPITLFCQMLNRCKMFKTCFCLCIPYTASGHHCFGHPRAWTPSWFIARTLMARYWTQILNRSRYFPSFPFCFAKLDRQLFDGRIASLPVHLGAPIGYPGLLDDHAPGSIRTVASGLRPVSSKKFLETHDSTIHMHFFFVNHERDKLLAVTAKQGCHKRFYWTIITVTILSILLYS